MLGDIDRGATVFTAECKSLKKAQQYENDWSGNSNRVIARKKSNRSGRSAHDQQRHEKSELSTDQVADSSKHKRTEWTNGKSDGECCESFEEVDGGVAFWIELRRDDRLDASAGGRMRRLPRATR